MAEAVEGQPRAAHAHRREAGRGRLRQDLRQHQSGHRGGHRPGRRRLGRRDAAGHRRGPPGLRRDRLGYQPRLPQAVPRAAARGAQRRGGGAARAADPRGGLSVHDDPGPAARCAPVRGAGLARQGDRQLRMGDGAARRHGHHGQRRLPAHLARAGRRGRRHHPVELPGRGHAAQGRPGPGHGQHHDRETGTRHAVERHTPRPHRRREDGHPRRRDQRGDVVGPPGGGGADAVAQGRPDQLHRIRPRLVVGSWRRAPRP